MGHIDLRNKSYAYTVNQFLLKIYMSIPLSYETFNVICNLTQNTRSI